MRFVAGRGAVAERHREDVAGRGRRDRVVAGRGAVAELLLAGAPWRSAIGKILLAGGAVAERHRESVAGRGAAAKIHLEAVAARSSLREDNAAASGSSCGGLPFKVALMVFCPLFGKEAPSGDELWG